MNLSEPFIRRPVMTTLVMASLLLFGVLAYRQLPVSDLPNVDFPTVQVSASLPGASPETMASAVATVLERQFSTIAGIDSMNSVSSLGSAQITLQFALERDIDAAAQDVQAAISRAARQLPPDMPSPPSFQKVNPADSPILNLVLTSPTLPMWELNEYGETLIAQRISMISGVAQVQVYGSQKYAVRVQVDPASLFVRRIGLDEVAEAIQKGNVNLPTGVLYGPQRAAIVKASGQLTRAAQYQELIVAYRNGAPVRVREIGRAVDAVENDKVAAWYCTPDAKQRAIFLAVLRQPGMNTIEVAAAVKKMLPLLSAQLPAAAQLHVMYDRSLPIQRSAEDAEFTMYLTLVLVVLVIFLFLRNLPATVIPSLALPMSMIGTFIVMHLLGFSLDNLSLMALTLAMGFVVDDAIVVLENIVRHAEMGKNRLQAALDGSRQIGFTVVSMTLSLAAVFIPVLFMGGLVGRIFREFAVVIGVAVILSGVISLSLTPMLCSRFLQTDHHASAGGARRDGWLLRGYARSLDWSLRHRRLVLVVSVALLAATYFLSRLVPKGFLPNEDQDMISVSTEAPEGTSFQAMVAYQHELADIVRRDPGVKEFMSSAGARGSSGGNSGRMFVHLLPRRQRPDTADQIVQRLRGRLAGVPGIRSYPNTPSTLQIGGRVSKSQYQYTLLGPDTEELYPASQRLLDRMQEIPGIADLASDLQLRNPELNVVINRDLAASLGVSAEQVETALLNAYGTRQVSTIFAPNNQYAVLLELNPEHQRHAEALSLLHIRSGSGALVPLRSVASVEPGVGPLTLNHSGQNPAVTLSFNLRPGTSLGDAVARIEALGREVLPAGITGTFQGTAQAFQASTRGMGLLLLLAVVVIYVVLGILYENFWHPLTILTALPFAGVGALLALYLFRSELSLYAFVGIIMLVGLVKKNGIMMVDFAVEARRAGKSAEEAIREACLVRFRPIMMTTIAALMAGIPIALGYGAGGEARRPLGLAVVGGLLFSQSLTLYVTPVFYLYMERWQARSWRPRAAAPLALLLALAALLPSGARGETAGAATNAPPDASAAPLQVDVAGAILSGLRNNRSLRVQQLDVKITRTFEDQARADFTPTLDAEISAGRENAADLRGGALTNVEHRTTAAKVGVGVLTTPGARLAVSGGLSGDDAASEGEELDQARLGVEVAQPLLRDRGRRVNLVQLRQARLDTRVSQHELRGFTESLVAGIESTYWDLWLARRRVAIAEDAFKLAEDQLAQTRDRIRVGTLARVELAAAEAEVASRRELLIQSRAASESSRLALLQLISPPGTGMWSRAVEVLEEPARAPEDLGPVEAHVATALRARPDLRQAALLLERDELELVRTRNGLLPRLDLFARLGRSGYADSFSGATRELPDGEDDATVGILLRYPLGRVEDRALHQRAQLSREQSQEAMENLTQLAELDVRTAYINAQRAAEQVAATAATRRLQEEVYRAERGKFGVGTSTSLLVAQAERNLLLAQLAEVQAVIGRRKAIVDLYRLEGALLEQRGLEVE